MPHFGSIQVNDDGEDLVDDLIRALHGGFESISIRTTPTRDLGRVHMSVHDAQIGIMDRIAELSRGLSDARDRVEELETELTNTESALKDAEDRIADLERQLKDVPHPA